MSLAAGIILDRDIDTVLHNTDGDAVHTFSVAAVDDGIPQMISYATVSDLLKWEL